MNPAAIKLGTDFRAGQVNDTTRLPGPMVEPEKRALLQGSGYSISFEKMDLVGIDGYRGCFTRITVR